VPELPLSSTCSKAKSASDEFNIVYTKRFPSAIGIILRLDLGINFFLQTFVGNIDRNSEVKHVLYGVLTRYLRFVPKTHKSRVCMRTEVFGVKTKPGDKMC